MVNSSGFLINKSTPSSYPLPIGMFSVTLKNSLYTGPIFNVRRSTDNSTVDVYSDASGNYTLLGGSSYATWLGAGLGYVTIWYNQSGATHMYQTTTTNQPQLLSTTLDVSFNGGNPNGNTYLYSGSGTGSYTADFNSASMSIATCCTFRTSGTINAIISSRTGTVGSLSGYTFYKYDTNSFTYQLGNGGSWRELPVPASFAINTQYKAVLQCPNTGIKTGTVNATTATLSAYTFPRNTVFATRIGAGMTETTPSFYFAGTMKDVFIYNTAISDAHRTQLISTTLG